MPYLVISRNGEESLDTFLGPDPGHLKGTHRSGFCKFGSKTYIELFTYLCRQIIELALYTHLNSAKKNIFLQKVSFVACPIVLR